MPLSLRSIDDSQSWKANSLVADHLSAHYIRDHYIRDQKLIFFVTVSIAIPSDQPTKIFLHVRLLQMHINL